MVANIHLEQIPAARVNFLLQLPSRLGYRTSHWPLRLISGYPSIDGRVVDMEEHHEYTSKSPRVRFIRTACVLGLFGVHTYRTIRAQLRRRQSHAAEFDMRRYRMVS